MKILSKVTAIMLVAVACSQGPVMVVEPLTEGQANPQALHTGTPSFSWKITSDLQDVRQESYRLLVASSEDKLKDNVGDLWDSGEVLSGVSVFIPYEGKELGSREKAWWKVIVNTNKGMDESDIAYFGTSILNPQEITAKWIGHDFEDDVLEGKTQLALRHLRKEFELGKKVKEAKLYISGLGLYEAFINGNEVGSDDHLKPVVSDYDKTVYFNTYDVTDVLKKGKNTIGVELGAGRFTGLRHREIPGKRDGTRQFRHYGVPRMIAQLEVTYADGSSEIIVSDESWRITNQGPVRLNNLFDGERYDARMEMDGWDRNGYGSWRYCRHLPHRSGCR